MDIAKMRRGRSVAVVAGWLLWFTFGVTAGAVAIVFLEESNLLKYFDDHGAGVTAIFTIVLAVATIALCAATALLWVAGEKQIKVARDSADASSVAARAATESVELARDTARRQLRAYVSFPTVEVRGFQMNIGSVPIVRVVMENVGQTPAYNASAAIDVALADFPFEQEVQPRPGAGNETFTIGPGHKMTRQLPLEPLTQEMIDRLRSREQAILVFGTITYTDVFGDSHLTTLNAMTMNSGNNGPPNWAQSLSARPNGNSAN